MNNYEIYGRLYRVYRSKKVQWTSKKSEPFPSMQWISHSQKMHICCFAVQCYHNCYRMYAIQAWRTNENMKRTLPSTKIRHFPPNLRHLSRMCTAQITCRKRALCLWSGHAPRWWNISLSPLTEETNTYFFIPEQQKSFLYSRATTVKTTTFYNVQSGAKFPRVFGL